jgi:hypothetical protein
MKKANSADGVSYFFFILKEKTGYIIENLVDCFF